MARQSAGDASSTLIAAFLSAVVALSFMSAQHQLIHWFIVPIILCGAIIGTDLVEWLRGRLGLFDPNGLIGLLGYHFFFLAPILMVSWNYRMMYLPDQPEDYRAWLGGMAMMNCAGLLTYRWVRKKVALRILRSQARKLHTYHVWKIEPKRFWVFLSLSTLVSCVTQAWIFVSFGGIRGYMNTYTDWLSGQDLFHGSALVFAIAESSPILLVIGVAVWARGKQKTWITLSILVCLLAMLEFIVGGLRGSRSNVIWSLFWIAGIVHLYVRRFPRILALAALCVLYGFVSLYAAYKQNGSILFDKLAISGDYSAVSDTAESPATVLVGDFSRCDVQAYLFYKIFTQQLPSYALGQSYLGALTMIVPNVLWQDRPSTIVKWTTNAEYGTGAYESGSLQSSRVYGIAGEAMLNFGPAGLLFAYAVLGTAVAAVRVFMRKLQSDDSRLFILPFIINFLFLLLLNDSDNGVFYLIKYGLMPVSLIILSSSHLKLQGRSYGNSQRSSTRYYGLSGSRAL